MASPIPREWEDGTEHKVIPSWWQHFLWPPGLSQMEHKDMLHATYRLKIAISYRNKRHFPRETCPYELGMLMKIPSNWSKLRWALKVLLASLDVTSFDSFGELVMGCRNVCLFEYNILSFSFKGLSELRITRVKANGSKPLSFEEFLLSSFLQVFIIRSLVAS
jgi:hypothetical protein